MTSGNYILWGATGQSVVLNELFSQKGMRLVALYDRNPEVKNPFSDVPLYHEQELFFKKLSDLGSLSFSVAIGGAGGDHRLSIHDLLIKKGLNPLKAIHSTAAIASDANIGEGNQILISATVSALVQTGRQVIINSGAVVDHESILNDGVHIGPGAVLAGEVTVGTNSFIGSGAIVLPRVKIGSNTVIGAGSIVTENIPDNVIAYGSPCKVMRTNG